MHFEIIVVDDGSLDHGLETAPPSWRIFSFTKSHGSGAARKLGTEASNGDWIAWIDADGTYRMEDLLACLRAIRPGIHQVIGCRSTDYGQWKTCRLLVKRLASNLASVLFQSQILDLNSGLRVFSRESAKTWLHWLPPGFSCTTTATLAALGCGQNLAFLPIDYCPRAHGTRSKFRPFADGAKLFATIFRICWLSWCRHLARMKRRGDFHPLK